MLLPLTLIGISGIGSTPAQSQIASMVASAAAKYGVPANLALGIAAHESGFNPSATNVNTNGTTDWGVMQLNDLTVKTLGVSNPLDPQQNIDAGVKLLGSYLTKYNGDESKALWAYASGPGAVSGGSMNSTARQFIDYVTGYVPEYGFDPGGGLPDPVSSDPGFDFSQDTIMLGSLEFPTLAATAVVVLIGLAWLYAARRS